MININKSNPSSVTPNNNVKSPPSEPIQNEYFNNSGTRSTSLISYISKIFILMSALIQTTNRNTINNDINNNIFAPYCDYNPMIFGDIEGMTDKMKQIKEENHIQNSIIGKKYDEDLHKIMGIIETVANNSEFTHNLVNKLEKLSLQILAYRTGIIQAKSIIKYGRGSCGEIAALSQIILMHDISIYPQLNNKVKNIWSLTLTYPSSVIHRITVINAPWKDSSKNDELNLARIETNKRPEIERLLRSSAYVCDPTDTNKIWADLTSYSNIPISKLIAYQVPSIRNLKEYIHKNFIPQVDSKKNDRSEHLNFSLKKLREYLLSQIAEIELHISNISFYAYNYK